jgi:hypothetical protein
MSRKLFLQEKGYFKFSLLFLAFQEMEKSEFKKKNNLLDF